MKRLAGVALLIVVASSCATPASSVGAGAGSAPLTPLILGWEQFFTLTWTAGTYKNRPVVSGRIYNKWNFAAANVRLLVDELDADGQIINQELGWLGFTLTPGTTAPFEIPVKHATPNHRVSVFAYDWVQSDRGRWRH